MADKMLTEFIDPIWIVKLKKILHERNMARAMFAEDLGISDIAVSNLFNQNNNPSESLRIIITEKYGITFDSVKIKDLILTVSRISDKKISSNGKRVLQLLLLFEGKAPGAEIKVDDLKEEGFFYGYRSKEIDAAIKRLAAFGLVKQKQDKVKLDFKNCKKVWLEYQEKCKRIIIKSIEKLLAIPGLEAEKTERKKLDFKGLNFNECKRLYSKLRKKSKKLKKVF